MSIFGDLFGNSNGEGAGSNILGALTTGAQIYNSFQGNQRQEDATNLNNQFAQQKFEEEKRQFDMNYALAQAKLAQGGGGGGGGGANIAAQMAAKKAELIQAAYQNMSKLALEGRTGEATQLGNLMTGINQVLLSRPQGSVVR